MDGKAARMSVSGHEHAGHEHACREKQLRHTARMLQRLSTASMEALMQMCAPPFCTAV